MSVVRSGHALPGDGNSSRWAITRTGTGEALAREPRPAFENPSYSIRLDPMKNDPAAKPSATGSIAPPTAEYGTPHPSPRARSIQTRWPAKTCHQPLQT